MKMGYDQKEFEVCDTFVSGLERYALAVLETMQKEDPEFADCWTACLITIDELQPEFEWGSIEDISDEGGFYVELPIAPSSTINAR